MVNNVIARVMVVLFLCSFLLAAFAFAAEVTPFSASPLVKLGDEVKYGSYIIRKIGDGIYQINDPGDKTAKGGGVGCRHVSDLR